MKQSGSSERAAGPEERTTSTAGPASRSRRHGLWSHSATPRGVRRTACATGSQGRGPPWPMPDPGAQTRKACWESRCQLTTITGCPARRNLHEDTSAHEQIFDLLVSAVRDCTAIGDRRRSCVLGRRLEQDYARLSWWIKIPWLPARPARCAAAAASRCRRQPCPGLPGTRPGRLPVRDRAHQAHGLQDAADHHRHPGWATSSASSCPCRSSTAARQPSASGWPSPDSGNGSASWTPTARAVMRGPA